MLTLLSMIGLLVTLLDYAVPRIQAKLFPENSWSPEKERKLENICQELVTSFFVQIAFLNIFLLLIFFLFHTSKIIRVGKNPEKPAQWVLLFFVCLLFGFLNLKVVETYYNSY